MLKKEKYTDMGWKEGNEIWQKGIRPFWFYRETQIERVRLRIGYIHLYILYTKSYNMYTHTMWYIILILSPCSCIFSCLSHIFLVSTQNPVHTRTLTHTQLRFWRTSWFTLNWNLSIPFILTVWRRRETVEVEVVIGGGLIQKELRRQVVQRLYFVVVYYNGEIES